MLEIFQPGTWQGRHTVHSFHFWVLYGRIFAPRKWVRNAWGGGGGGVARVPIPWQKPTREERRDNSLRSPGCFNEGAFIEIRAPSLVQGRAKITNGERRRERRRSQRGKKRSERGMPIPPRLFSKTPFGCLFHEAEKKHDSPSHIPISLLPLLECKNPAQLCMITPREYVGGGGREAPLTFSDDAGSAQE